MVMVAMLIMMMTFLSPRSTSSSLAGPRNLGRGLDCDSVRVGQFTGGEAG